MQYVDVFRNHSYERTKEFDLNGFSGAARVVDVVDFQTLVVIVECLPNTFHKFKIQIAGIQVENDKKDSAFTRLLQICQLPVVEGQGDLTKKKIRSMFDSFVCVMMISCKAKLKAELISPLGGSISELLLAEGLATRMNDTSMVHS